MKCNIMFGLDLLANHVRSCVGLELEDTNQAGPSPRDMDEVT